MSTFNYNFDNDSTKQSHYKFSNDIIKIIMKQNTTTTICLCLLITIISTIKAQDRNRYIIALECIRQVGIERHIIEQAMITTILPNDDKYKQFLTCSYKKQGYQNENGEILIDNIKKFLMKFYDLKQLSIIDNCGNNNNNNTGTTISDHGENAYNAVSCILPKLKQLDRIEE